MPATLSPLVRENELKEYLIFRVEEAEDHVELADESALEQEAARYAALRDEAEPDSGIHYEVRRADSGGLLYSTADPQQDPQDVSKEAPWRRIATS